MGIWVLSLTIIAGSLGITLGLEYAMNQAKLRQTTSSPEDLQYWSLVLNVISFASQIVTVAINGVITALIPIFASLEKHYSYSGQLISTTNKTLVSLVINTSMLPVLSRLAIRGQSPFEPDGLAQVVFDYALTNALVPNLLLLLDPGYFLRRFLFSLPCYLHSKVQSLSQRELNLSLEGPVLDPSATYKYALNYVTFAAFYLPLQPAILLFLLAGLILRYFILRYLLVTRYKRPATLHPSFNWEMTKNLWLVPLFYAAGSILFAWAGRSLVLA